MASLGLATGVVITPAVDDMTTNTALNAALGDYNTSPNSASSESKVVTGTPSCNILVHNMFDKDEETDPGWRDDIKEEFVEEASNYGTIAKQDGKPCVIVMHDKPGGMVYSKFETVESAKSCAEALCGRWFDKRQLRVEYVDQFPQ